MKGSFLAVALLSLALGVAPGALAQVDYEPTDLLRALVRLRSPGIENLAARPELVRAVAQANAAELSLEQIQQRDAEWIATAELTPLKRGVVENPAGRLLRGFIQRSPQTYSEALLTDNQGALVAAYPVPSDYWQGDEPQFQRPWQSGELWFGPIQFDESADAYSVKVALQVKNDDGMRIGVLSVGVRLSK